MNRVLLIVGGLLVGLLAALFVVPVFVDWTRYRGTFEEEATRLLGRDVRVGGKVNLRLLPTPYIRFEKVRITDTKATVGEPLFKADDFTIWLAVSPLLRGDVEASVIELHKPVLVLVLDDHGGGNWTNLAEPAEKTSSAPNKIAFDNVRINNGTIAIFGPAGDEKTRFEHINGEFSSPAIEGPYKIAAAFAHAGMPRELRLSTAKPEPDGAIRLKGIVRAPVTGVSYSLDGKLMDLFRLPRLQGELKAKLPLLNAPASSEKQPAARSQASESFDLKSTIKADVSGAEFGDITLAFEQDGQPQLATGTARMVWRDQATATVKLHSPWLDIDRMSGREGKTQLPEQLQRFAKSLDAVLPADIQTTLSIDLDQATLGGDIIGGMAIAAERKERVLGIRASAGLPGGSRFEANGIITPAGSGHAFDGDINLRGTSAARFLAWAGRNTSLPAITRDGPFAISGRTFLGAESISGRNLAIQFAGNNVTGEASWSHGAGGRQITLALDGGELDLTPLVGPQTTPLAALKSLVSQLGDLAPPSSAPVPNASSPEATPTITARLRTSQLTAGRTNLQDVTVNLRYAGGDLSIPQLRFGSDAGWSVEIQGDIAGLAKPGSKGGITWAMTAETAQGLQDLIAAGELGSAWLLTPKRATALMPLRMAGQVRIGEHAATAYNASFDGNLGPTRASGTIRIDPKGDSWRDHRADVAITLDGTDAGRMMQQLAPDSWSPAAAVATRQPGRILLRGIGTPKAGLVSLASIETSGLAAEYRGRLHATETARLGAEGELRMAATDIGQTLALAGIRERTNLANLPVSGVIAISGSQDRLRLASARLDMGTVALSGNLELETRPAGPRLSGRLITNQMSVPVVLGFLTLPKSQTRLGPPPPPAMGPPPPQLAAWSEDAFDLAAIANFDSKIRIETANLVLTPDIMLGNAVVELETNAGRVDLKLSEASALAGKLAGTLQLDRSTAGAIAKIAVGLKEAKLEASAAPGSKPAATGTMSLQLGLEGTALNPRNLIAALQGKGEIVIGGGQIYRLAPRGLDEVVEAMLAIKGDPPQGELARRLTAALGAGTVLIGRRTIALQATDGVVRFAPLALDTPKGRLTGTTTIDLEALRFDSEWRIDPNTEAKPAPPPNGKQKAPLPGVVAVYAAPLSHLGIVEPRLQFEALEREIAVRKVERDLEELERLRKLDDERIRIEAERRQKVEAEKAAATSAPPVPVPPISVPPISVPPISAPSAPPVPVTTAPVSIPVPAPAAAAPVTKAPVLTPAPVPPTPEPAAVNPASPPAPATALQPLPPAARAEPRSLIQVPSPVTPPPALDEPPHPAAPPSATTNGSFSPPAQMTPPPTENITAPTPALNPPQAAEPAPKPSAAKPAAQQRPEPQPKAERKDVFGDQTRAAP